MTKIINVITDTNIGGAGYVLCNYLKHSDRTRFVHAVVLPEKSLLRKKLESFNVKIIEAAGIADKSASFRGVKELIKIFKSEKPDIVHAHASLSARFAARLCKIPIVYTRHSAFNIPKWRKSRLMRFIQGFINNSLSAKIIAVSPAASENLRELGVDMKKVRLIFNGADAFAPLSEAEAEAARERFGVNHGEFVCSILARLTPVKGHEYVIKAAEMLKDEGIRFLIAGTGEIENELKKSAKGFKNVTFVGFVSDPRALLGITDIILNASYGTEATSLSLLESMSLGVPAVVSDFGGNPFVIETGVNGVVIEKRNAAILAETILKVKSDLEFYKVLSDGAKARFEQFTAERMAQKIERLYMELIN
jgi:glycosyltransferase involved in cell wall biosynthesis